MRKKVTAEIAIAAIGTNQATSATSWGIGKLILQAESQRTGRLSTVSQNQAQFENNFYNIIDDVRVSASKRLSVVNPATAKHLAAVPDVDRAFLNKAISAARNAFAGWNAVPVERRKTILARLLNTIGDRAHELSALLATEQGGALGQARWEIDLLTKAFGPALMQMELHEKEDEVQQIEHVTKSYVPIDFVDAESLWNLPVILSFGKVLPALLPGETVILRPFLFAPLTVLCISDYIRELLPPGVFNVVTGGREPGLSFQSSSNICSYVDPNPSCYYRRRALGRPVPGSNAGRHMSGIGCASSTQEFRQRSKQSASSNSVVQTIRRTNAQTLKVLRIK